MIYAPVSGAWHFVQLSKNKQRNKERATFIYLVITDGQGWTFDIRRRKSLLCETLNAESEQNNTCSINTPDCLIFIG